MPKNSVAPQSSVHTVSGGGGGVGRPTNPTPNAAARANFSAGTSSDAGSKVSSNGTAAARKFTTNGDVRIPLHPSEPRGDDARGRVAT